MVGKNVTLFWIRNGTAFIVIMCVALCLLGCGIQIKENETVHQTADIPIDMGIELRSDLNGDGEEDRVYVKDVRSGDEAYTQLTAAVGNALVVKDYMGYYSSYLATGDLSGNGKADVLLVRCDTGSNYGAAEISLLYFDDDNEWREYPKNFIHNPDIALSQPDKFGDAENWWDLERYIGAALFHKDGKPMVRFIALLEDDISQDTVKIIEASYRDEGWYIENMEIIDNYYTENKGEDSTVGTSRYFL